MRGRGGAAGIEVNRLNGAALGVIGLRHIAIGAGHAPGQAVEAEGLIDERDYDAELKFPRNFKPS